MLPFFFLTHKLTHKSYASFQLNKFILGIPALSDVTKKTISVGVKVVVRPWL